MSIRSNLSALLFVSAYMAAGNIQALASEGCSTAPKAKFQDRAKLDDILKPKGLMINKINEERGCYKVVAVTRQFKTVTMLFNAETLQQVTAAQSKASSKTESAPETDNE